jgi:hypothetical protein
MSTNVNPSNREIYGVSPFPSFRNIDGYNTPINNYNPTSVPGIGQTGGLVRHSDHKFYSQLNCNEYPSAKMGLPNEMETVNEINSIGPIETGGDIVFGVNPEYLKETNYVYNGLTLQQVNAIQEYEGKVGMEYLKKFLDDQNTSTKIGNQTSGLYNSDVRTGRTLVQFLLDRKYKILDKMIDERFNLSLKPRKKHKFTKIKKKLKDIGKSWDILYRELQKIDIGLLCCFSMHHTMKKYLYLGVCDVVEEQKNDNEIHFKRIRFQHRGRIQTFLLSPQKQKKSKCNCYFYQLYNNEGGKFYKTYEPVKIFIYNSNVDLKEIKDMMGFNDEHIEYEKERTTIRRGHFIGQISDPKYDPYYDPMKRYLMQKFPYKGLKDKVDNMSYTQAYKLMHTNVLRRELDVNASY